MGRIIKAEKMTRYCLVSGVGVGEYAISSFDSALLDAGIGDYNLVRVSSILPPNSQQCQKISRSPGSILFTAYASLTTKDASKIASAVAIAIPEKSTECGVIMEYSDTIEKTVAIKIVEHLAEDAMHRRGIPSKMIVSAGVDVFADGTMFFTTFAGIGMF